MTAPKALAGQVHAKLMCCEVTIEYEVCQDFVLTECTSNVHHTCTACSCKGEREVLMLLGGRSRSWRRCCSCKTAMAFVCPPVVEGAVPAQWVTASGRQHEGWGSMSDFHRLAVNITPASAAILRKVTVQQDISLTEAIRRAIALLGYFSTINTGRALSCEDLPGETILAQDQIRLGQVCCRQMGDGS